MNRLPDHFSPMQCCQVDWSENNQILSQKEQKRRKELLCSAIVWFLQSMPTQKSPEELKNSKFATRFGNTAFSSSFLLLFSDNNKISNKAPFLLHTRYRPLLPSQRGVAYIVVALCPYAEAKRELGRSKKRRKALYFLVPNQTYFFLIHGNFCGSKEIIPQIHKQCNCKLLWIFLRYLIWMTIIKIWLGFLRWPDGGATGIWLEMLPDGIHQVLAQK